MLPKRVKSAKKRVKNFGERAKLWFDSFTRGYAMNLRQMEIVTDADKLKVDIQQTCMQYKTIKQWAYILHDKDDTRPHYHIYLNFMPNTCDTALVAKWFNLGWTDEDGKEHSGENFIEKVKGRKTDVLLYLTHGNDSQKNKHQYSPSEVHANFDFETEIENSKILGDFEHYSYAQQLQYVNSLPLSEKAQAFTKLEKLWRLRCQVLALNTDRQLQVVFICGRGGTGKTYYAKKLLQNLDYDFCISSSSNDPFQDYMGQKAIILDDLRDKSFEFEDLLKILDNDTSSSVRSRFSNKVFNGEMIVITSSVPLVYWYKDYQYSKYDELNQLYRRISCYVHMTETEITVYDELDKFGKPVGLGQVFKNELAGMKYERKKTVNFKEIFGRFCENADDDMPERAAKQEQLKINFGG